MANYNYSLLLLGSFLGILVSSGGILGVYMAQVEQTQNCTFVTSTCGIINYTYLTKNITLRYTLVNETYPIITRSYTDFTPGEYDIWTTYSDVQCWLMSYDPLDTYSLQYWSCNSEYNNILGGLVALAGFGILILSLFIMTLWKKYQRTHPVV